LSSAHDASLAPELYEASSAGVDFIVRGEGDLTFRELLRAIEAGATFQGIAGLSPRGPLVRPQSAAPGQSPRSR
jgi:radical SAM superfamily enzyme YgiQ (UPF0313 family)